MRVAVSDADLLALCIFEEAAGEPDDGRAAVAYVVKNRMRSRFQSDGTLAGTILKPNQFSWVNWSMVGGKYVRVAATAAQVKARLDQLLATNKTHFPKVFEACAEIGRHVLDGTYQGGPHYAQLTAETVNYVNPRIVSRPAWATPDRFVCSIGHHDFYRA